MVIKGNRIIGINFDEEFETELLQYFIEKDEIILFPWRDCNLENEISEYDKNFKLIEGSNWNNFVLEHTLIKSSDDVFNWNLPNGETFLWYCPNNREELARIIRRGWITYSCCIIPKGKGIRDYTFQLSMYEHDTFKGKEVRSLFIREKKKGHFKFKIYPLIKPVIEKYSKKHEYVEMPVYYFIDE